MFQTYTKYIFMWAAVEASRPDKTQAEGNLCSAAMWTSNLGRARNAVKLSSRVQVLDCIVLGSEYANFVCDAVNTLVLVDCRMGYSHS